MSRRLKLTPEVVATIWRLRMIQRWTVPKIARELALATSTVERALAGRSKQEEAGNDAGASQRQL